MKRWILILMAFLTGLSSVSGGVIAAPKHKSRHGGDAPTTVERRSDGETKAPRPAGLTDPPPLLVRNGELVPTGDTRETVSAQAAEPTCTDGNSSKTEYEWRNIDGSVLVLPLTLDQIGYCGTPGLKVGDLYYGSVYIGNSSSRTTAVAADIVLPPNTAFAIDANAPNQQVVCAHKNSGTVELTPLTGADCPQTPSPGIYGARFAPLSNANHGAWWLAPGEAVLFIFPIRSQTELKGLGSPGDCMILSVIAAGALRDDHPEPTDTCPLPEGQGLGSSVGVLVAPGTTPPPTVTPPTVDDGTQTPPKKDKKKGKKGKGKKGKAKKR